MSKKAFVCLVIIFLGPALACALGSGGNESAARQVSLQSVPTLVSTPTTLPIVEDIERVSQETPESTLVVSTTIIDTIITDTIRAATEEGANLAVSAPDNDNDRENSEATTDRANDIVTLNTATTTPTPIPTDTPTPTLTPSPVVVSSGWPPILPDATDVESGDGYVHYITGSDVGAVTDFYRREMARYGWAEMNESELAAAMGLADFSTLVPMPDGGTLLIFSKDGGQTLSFLIIAEVGGQVEVALGWATE